MPIKTSENVEDKSFQRNTVQEVYDLILSDLDIADKELTAYGAQPSKYRSDSVAVHFLKSRVYLYMQNWEMAARYAQKVINEHPTLQNLNALAASPELIFSMGGNAMPCYTMNYIKSFTITDKIYGLYSDDDLRKSKYIWTNGDFHGYAKTPIIATNLTQEPTDPQYYFYAYYSPTSFNHVDISDKFCFRSAEAYLIKAERMLPARHSTPFGLSAMRQAPTMPSRLPVTTSSRRYATSGSASSVSKDSDGSTSDDTASARCCRRKRLSRTIIITTRAAAPPDAQPSTLSPSNPTTGDGCYLSRRKSSTPTTA